MFIRTSNPDKAPTTGSTLPKHFGAKVLLAAGVITGSFIGAYPVASDKVDNAPTVRPFKEDFTPKPVPGSERLTLLPGRELSEGGMKVYVNEMNRHINESHNLEATATETPAPLPAAEGPTLEQIEASANMSGGEAPTAR